MGGGWPGGGSWALRSLELVVSTCLSNLRAELYLLRVEPLLLARLFVAGVECQGVHGVRGGWGIAQARGHGREGQRLGGEHRRQHLDRVYLHGQGGWWGALGGWTHVWCGGGHGHHGGVRVAGGGGGGGGGGEGQRTAVACKGLLALSEVTETED